MRFCDRGGRLDLDVIRKEHLIGRALVHLTKSLRDMPGIWTRRMCSQDHLFTLCLSGLRNGRQIADDIERAFLTQPGSNQRPI